MQLPNSTTFYILRHGQSEVNLTGQYGLLPHSPLTNLGRKQSHEAADRFRTVRFDHIFSSDFVRTKQTAEIIAKEHDLIVKTSKAIREQREDLLLS